MSMPPGPPLTPTSTASGIILDPKTLERVVPATKRRDGSVRKEQKVRAGYVPQEDVGAFRGRRQLAAEAQRGIVPGSARPVGLAAAAAAVHPYSSAQNSDIKPKPLVTSERKAKKLDMPSGHNWDSESEDDEPETAEEARLAFGLLNIKDEDAFPALGGKPKPKAEKTEAPKEEKTTTPKETKSNDRPQPVAKPEATAPASKTEPTTTPVSPSYAVSPAPAASSPPLSPPTPADSTPVWRAKRGGRGGARGGFTPHPQQQARPQTKPHPIQGGRKGPIGLAHPPSVEEYERSQRKEPRPRTQRPQKQTPRHVQRQPQQPSPERAPEPRVRQPVKMREGGPLGAVRNILLQNQAGEQRPRREPKAAVTSGQ